MVGKTHASRMSTWCKGMSPPLRPHHPPSLLLPLPILSHCVCECPSSPVTSTSPHLSRPPPSPSLPLPLPHPPPRHPTSRGAVHVLLSTPIILESSRLLAASSPRWVAERGVHQGKLRIPGGAETITPKKGAPGWGTPGSAHRLQRCLRRGAGFGTPKESLSSSSSSPPTSSSPPSPPAFV